MKVIENKCVNIKQFTAKSPALSNFTYFVELRIDFHVFNSRAIVGASKLNYSRLTNFILTFPEAFRQLE
jgi:hypothetical protein